MACTLYLLEPKLNNGIYSFGKILLKPVECFQKKHDGNLKLTVFIEGRACCFLDVLGLAQCEQAKA